MMQAREHGIEGCSMKIILQNLPLPEGATLHFLNSLNGLRTHLLQDRTVFILTFLLGKIFSRPRLGFQLVPIFQIKIPGSLFPAAIFILFIKSNVCLSNIKTKVCSKKNQNVVFIIMFVSALLNMEEDSEVRWLWHGIVSLLRKYLNTR